MRIAVLLKDVPDTDGERDLDLETGLAVRTGDNVADEVGERAVEAALKLAEAHGGEVELLSLGPAASDGSIRKGIAMGAKTAHMVHDDALVGADFGLTAEVLAALVRRGEYDLVVAGNLSSDGGGGVVPTMVAELLGWPNLTNLTSVEVDGAAITAHRASDGVDVELAAELPAVISVTDAFPDARFPNFKGLMAAKKQELTPLTLADLGIDANDFTPARAIVLEAAKRPPREAGTVIDDDGTACLLYTSDAADE